MLCVLMMVFTGLYQDETTRPQMMNFVSDRQLILVEHSRSSFARGSRVRLPCRMSPSTS